MTTRAFYSVMAGVAILDVPGCVGGGPGRPPNGCSGRVREWRQRRYHEGLSPARKALKRACG